MFEKFFKRKVDILKETDPDRIYVENIRKMLNTSTSEAIKICDIAVEEGILRKKYALECKNNDCGRIIKVYDRKEDIPSSIICRTCELDGHINFEFETKDLTITEFYQYV